MDANNGTIIAIIFFKAPQQTEANISNNKDKKEHTCCFLWRYGLRSKTALSSCGGATSSYPGS